MAISRHDPEWKRVIAMAALGGVTFEKRVERPQGSVRNQVLWYALMPRTAGVAWYRGSSKYEVACRAVSMLGAAEKFLPDAASPRTAPPGPGGDELRSSP